MKNKAYFIAVLYFLFLALGNIHSSSGHSSNGHSFEARTRSLSGEAIWRMANYRSGLIEVGMIRPSPVLLLSSERAFASRPLDMALSFDEGSPSRFRDSLGRYRVSVSPELVAVDRRHARAGSGAVLFPGASPIAGTFHSHVPGNVTAGGPLVVTPHSDSALFSANNNIRDFTLEFWLHPLNMENGEQILQWVSARPGRSAAMDFTFQRILVMSSRNRLHWTFTNFFSSPDRMASIDVNLSGTTPLVPRTWSHHLIRFDAETGMLEYVVNGRPEAIVHVTSTGRERGEVYTPIAGENGSFVLGGNFTGMMDEFRIHGSFVPNAPTRRYPLSGGRIETRAIDLGPGNNRVLTLEASGGRASVRDIRASSEFQRNGRFRFSDDSEMQFFIRASNNPFRWDNPWQTVTPGESIAEVVIGRYVQLAVDFYPSADGEASPYLEEIRIVYLRDEPPLPPTRLVAVAMDGAVHLTWRHSPNSNTQGYLVYYGTADNEFFGEGATLGPSPISVGMRNSVVIEGLQNGTLYFFRVAAYSDRGSNHLLDDSVSHHVGEFSNEARARPLRGMNTAR
ncbi:MAG: fibronectin type III domain-containing protein [Treponema sp.]|nr:fibronectin type III domain-containing protein [Treponema sp.]